VSLGGRVSPIPNMPIFWYMLRRWGTLKKIWASPSAAYLPSVPKNPGLATSNAALPRGSRT